MGGRNVTNSTLSYVLRNIDLSKGKIVRSVEELEAVLIEHHKTVTINSYGRFIGFYDYLILLKDGVKAGIILKCDSVDIHVYVYPKYRGQHIVSTLTGDGFLKDLWPDIDSVTCANREEYSKIKYLAEIAGFYLRN